MHPQFKQNLSPEEPVPIQQSRNRKEAVFVRLSHDCRLIVALATEGEGTNCSAIRR